MNLWDPQDPATFLTREMPRGPGLIGLQATKKKIMKPGEEGTAPCKTIMFGSSIRACIPAVEARFLPLSPGFES